jgi:hypothetical protein
MTFFTPIFPAKHKEKEIISEVLVERTCSPRERVSPPASKKKRLVLERGAIIADLPKRTWWGCVFSISCTNW